MNIFCTVIVNIVHKVFSIILQEICLKEKEPIHI